MNNDFFIKSCPSCGSDRIKQVTQDLVRRYKSQKYTVPAVTFYECPDCGEKVYDREAMLKIEACSPAYRKQTVEAM
ncbi:MAG: YgiT-type zinc finger protein [Candidatus Electrothrix sp. MAN1_4]|nr:YgiT-type zinc finger protein [Candidatus Electrothrix sp. MAN1_4]